MRSPRCIVARPGPSLAAAGPGHATRAIGMRLSDRFSAFAYEFVGAARHYVGGDFQCFAGSGGAFKSAAMTRLAPTMTKTREELKAAYPAAKDASDREYHLFINRSRPSTERMCAAAAEASRARRAWKAALRLTK
jgi:hypothetical protein